MICLKPIDTLRREEFVAVPLDVRHQALGLHTIAVGGIASCLAPVGQIVKLALLSNAVALVLAHNHPSGMSDPSPADEAVTRTIVEACQLVDVTVLDHLIVTATAWTSLRQRHPALFAVTPSTPPLTIDG